MQVPYHFHGQAALWFNDCPLLPTLCRLMISPLDLSV